MSPGQAVPCCRTNRPSRSANLFGSTLCVWRVARASMDGRPAFKTPQAWVNNQSPAAPNFVGNVSRLTSEAEGWTVAAAHRRCRNSKVGGSPGFGRRRPSPIRETRIQSLGRARAGAPLCGRRSLGDGPPAARAIALPRRCGAQRGEAPEDERHGARHEDSFRPTRRAGTKGPHRATWPHDGGMAPRAQNRLPPPRPERESGSHGA